MIIATPKLIGFPVMSIEGNKTAIWMGDLIEISGRVGSHYRCRVEYGSEGYRMQFHAWVHKRLLRVKR